MIGALFVDASECLTLIDNSPPDHARAAEHVDRRFAFARRGARSALCKKLGTTQLDFLSPQYLALCFQPAN
jgi:hypothetical protein